jgi:DNA-binding transcriptional LysR family regulator
MLLLFEEPMVFVCREDHALAGRACVDLTELAAEELVGFPPDFGLRRLVDDAFHAAGVRPNTLYEVPAGFAAIAELVGNGLGTAFMPVSEARRCTDLRPVQLTTPMTWRIYLASPPVDRMTPATARLAGTLLDAAARARTT